jgi:hypothetical protein
VRKRELEVRGSRAQGARVGGWGSRKVWDRGPGSQGLAPPIVRFREGELGACGARPSGREASRKRRGRRGSAACEGSSGKGKEADHGSAEELNGCSAVRHRQFLGHITVHSESHAQVFGVV